ncbi:IS91 family transposase [Escherichia coli]|nr:IS91 family transposase [Escherichia coli]
MSEYMKNEILEFLNRHDGGKTAEIAEALAVTDYQARYYLLLLEKAGMVQRSPLRRGMATLFTLQTLPTSGDPFGDGIGKVAGSSLHAGVAARADERKKLERLCRYISRPAVSEKRLSLTRGGNVRYQLKTPYRDGTTHVIFEPLDFIARLAALVPKPRVNLTRFHGVFAPNSRHRALVTPAKRGRGNKVRVADEPATPAQRRASMTWAQRLKRVFNIDIETCSGCGGAMKVIACIEDPIVIKQILDHLKHKAETSGTRALPESRAPPAELLLGLFD